MIAPVVPPVLPASGRAVALSTVALVRGPLPLPTLTPRRTSTVVYGLAALDDRGRVADRVIMQALGWSAGLRLDIRETGGVPRVLTDPTGVYQVTSQGHLRLPVALRHRCGLQAGDRVVLAADLDAARLLLARLGVCPADLLAAVEDERAPAPTFAEYIPVVRAAVAEGTRRVYGSYWNRIVYHWGSRRLDEPTPSEVNQLADHVKNNVVTRRNARGGRSAAEHLIAALRCIYRH